MKSLEVIVRANITVKSSIKNLLLRDASTVVSYRAGLGGLGGLSFFFFPPVLTPLTPCSPDSSDGVLGPHGCGGRRSPLVGHPPGCAGRAAGAGAAGAAPVEGEAWGGGHPLEAGPPGWAGRHLNCGSFTHLHAHVCIQQIYMKH